MLSRLPNLLPLRCFEAVARLGSMVAAADALNVTHGAVSKQIKGLEEDLGVLLFDRRNRGVYLTARGRWLADRLGPLFVELEHIISDFRTLHDRSGPLTISCEPTLCLRLIIPALAQLKRDYGLDVRVLAAGGPVDFGRDQCDLAIRRSDFAVPSDIEVRFLANEWTGPVLSPTAEPRSLKKMPLLLSDTRPNAWLDWMKRSGVSLSGPVIRYEHFFLAVQAAEAGQGVALASIHMVAKELASGRLQAPHAFLQDGTEYITLCPASHGDKRIEGFVGWLTNLMLANLASIPGMGTAIGPSTSR